MNTMNRRGFLGRGAALVGAAMIPIPKAMALVVPNALPLRWFAVGNDEISYSFLAENAEAARREYAWVHSATVDEECPECGECSCYEHNDDLNAPLDWVEVSHEFPAEFDEGNEPKVVDWLRAGFNVPCENCDIGEPTWCLEVNNSHVTALRRQRSRVRIAHGSPYLYSEVGIPITGISVTCNIYAAFSCSSRQTFIRSACHSTDSGIASSGAST